MNLHVGDQVEVDRLGMPFHGRWGVVHSLEEMVVWVRLVEYSKLYNGYVLTHPMKFETWELRVVKYTKEEGAV